MATRKTKEEIEALLDGVKDIIELDWLTYSGYKEKARFIDKEFGEWWATPYRVLVENRRHPKRAALKRTETNIQKYGTANPAASNIIKDRIRQVNLARYGVENAAQSEEIKRKIAETNIRKYGTKAPLQNPTILAKAQNTNMEKYGVKTALLTKAALEGKNRVDRTLVAQKMIETNLERYGNPCSLHGSNQEKTDKAILAKYGTKNYAQTSECTDKIRETCRRKYGTDWYSKTNEYQQKFTATSLDRFGVCHPFKAEEVKLKIRSSQVENGTLELLPNGQSKREWYLTNNTNVSFSHLCSQTAGKTFTTIEEWEEAVATISQSITSLEQLFSDALKVPFYNKKPHPELKYRPDFKISDNFFVNVDGLFWHSDKAIYDPQHHAVMRQAYNAIGYTLWQFHQDEVNHKLDIIKSMINNKLGGAIRLYGRSTSIGIASPQQVTEFINNNHLMGIGNSKRNFVLTIDNQIVAMMTYKIKNKTIIIDRYCSKLNTNILGGFSKLLRRIERDYMGAQRIEYWVDLRYGTGDFLNNLGFNHIRDVLSWKWTDGYETKHRLTSWSSPDNVRGWYKIYDAGQRLWVKELNGSYQKQQ